MYSTSTSACDIEKLELIYYDKMSFHNKLGLAVFTSEWRSLAINIITACINYQLHNDVVNQRFSTGGTRTTGGTPDGAKWYAKK